MIINGAMRVHDDGFQLGKITIPPMVAVCFDGCFIADRLKNPDHREYLHSKTDRFNVYHSELAYDHNRSLTQCYKVANQSCCDWIITPDQDELLPYSHLVEVLNEADKRNSKMVMFPFLNCWGDIDTVIHPSLNRTGPHAKAYKAGDVNFQIAGGGGFCVPSGYANAYHSPWPLRHLHMMTKEHRSMRLKTRGWVEPWAKDTPPTIPFDPDRTWKQWMKM